MTAQHQARFPAKLADELDRLTTVLLPGARPYWLDAADLPAELRVPGAIGYTGATLDAALADHLRGRGQWRGRAPAIVFDLATIGIDAAAVAIDDRDAAQLRRDCVLAIGLHELAHVAERFPTVDAQDDIPQDLVAAVVAFNSDLFAGVPRQHDIPPWHNHGPTWLRIVAHGWYRAKAAGIEIPIDLIWFGEQLGAPGVYAARESLAAELAHLAHVPLHDLKNHATPDEYAELWQYKILKWQTETRNVSTRTE